MTSKLNIFILSFVIVLTIVTSPSAFSTKRALEEEDAYSSPSFGKLPQDVINIIVKDVAFGQALNNQSPINLALACKYWCQVIIGEKEPLWQALQGITDEEDKAIYQTFINSTLIYIPQRKGAPKKIEFKISSLPNPFKGTFDLSSCDRDIVKVKITTDISAFFQINKENDYTKLHILIAPYFLIKQHIKSKAKPFEKIIESWDKATAPVGIFWRLSSKGDLSQYNNLTSASMTEICSTNLWMVWQKIPGFSSSEGNNIRRIVPAFMAGLVKDFTLSFVNQNKDHPKET